MKKIKKIIEHLSPLVQTIEIIFYIFATWLTAVLFIKLGNIIYNFLF